jgi:hypothetical protein
MSFSRTKLMDILADANEGQPELRQLKYDSLVSAAYRAESFADNLEDVADLVTKFASIATTTTHVVPAGFLQSCVDLLPAGHTASEAPLEDRIAWTLVDPILGPAGQPLLAACISSSTSETENIHAWARIDVLSRQGALPKHFVSTIASLELEGLRVR